MNDGGGTMASPTVDILWHQGVQQRENQIENQRGIEQVRVERLLRPKAEQTKYRQPKNGMGGTGHLFSQAERWNHQIEKKHKPKDQPGALSQGGEVQKP